MSMRNTIRSISGSEPHEDHGGWRNFLDTCEVRDEHEGTIFYGSVNCNYILLPNNVVLESLGFNGCNLMEAIKKEGWETVYEQFKKSYDEMKQLLAS